LVAQFCFDLRLPLAFVEKILIGGGLDSQNSTAELSFRNFVLSAVTRCLGHKASRENKVSSFSVRVLSFC